MSSNTGRKIIIVILIAAIIGIMVFCAVYQQRSMKMRMPVIAQIHITSDTMKDHRLSIDDGYVDAAIEIETADSDAVKGVGRIKLRGNSTLEAEKLSYAFKFNDDVEVLEMGEGKKWVLLANAYDPTLMRNYIALETARKLRLDYTSECRYADVWINDLYKGNYLITEPVADGSDRVDIHPAAGDFLVEYERTREDEDETSYIVTDLEYRYLIHDPKDPSESQAAYVLEVMNNIEESIKDAVLKNGSDTIEKLSQVIDVDSFVDYCVFAEFMKSVDLGFSSEYYYYKDGLLYAGPAWDYDLCAGNVNSSYYVSYSNLATTGDSSQGFWIDIQGKLLKELMNCPEFEELVWDRYRNEEVQKIFTDIYRKDGMIDRLSSAYKDSFEQNGSKAMWPEGKQYFSYAGTPLPTFEENVEYLRTWYEKRNKWLLENSQADKQ